MAGLTQTAPAEAPSPAPAAVERRRFFSSRAWRRFARQPVAMVAAFILLVLFLGGALVHQFTPGEAHINLSDEWRNHPPVLSGWHVFGTDNIGKDVLLRTLYGLHTSEQTALAATLLATALGVAIGSIAGYRGGLFDVLMMRLADLIGIIPLIVVFLAVYAYFTPVTAWKASVALACFLWIPVARVVRAEISSLRSQEFVQAALSLGASDRRIFARHLLPNGSGSIIVAATTLLGQVFILEAMLEFFGLGVSTAIQPTLGNLIGDGYRGVLQLGEGWWVWAFPAGVLLLILVCVNLVGDGIADALRPPRQR
ncbi:MAG TPA: ABC transporter permease [Gaiellaceae bacterium]|nr:ABC transporter permease [Gaiellaceae bacterium]